MFDFNHAKIKAIEEFGAPAFDLENHIIDSVAHALRELARRTNCVSECRSKGIISAEEKKIFFDEGLEELRILYLLIEPVLNSARKRLTGTDLLLLEQLEHSNRIEELSNEELPEQGAVS